MKSLTATETCTEQNFLQLTWKTEILSHKHLKAQAIIFFTIKSNSKIASSLIQQSSLNFYNIFNIILTA